MYLISFRDVKYNHYLEQKFLIAYQFLRKMRFEKLKLGTIPLANGITANVQSYCTIPSKSIPFEAHNRYFDIQYIISGEENFEIASRNKLIPSTSYDSEKDVVFFQEPAYKDILNLYPEDLVIVSPKEAHKPRVCMNLPCQVRKIVIKIPV